MTHNSAAGPMTADRGPETISNHERHRAGGHVAAVDDAPAARLRRRGAHPRDPGDRRPGLRRDPPHPRAALPRPPARTALAFRPSSAAPRSSQDRPAAATRSAPAPSHRTENRTENRTANRTGNRAEGRMGGP